MKDEDYNIPEDQDYTSAVSAYDCTGLIPAGTVHEKELEAYKELYPFGAPDMSSQEIAQMREKNKKDASDSAKQYKGKSPESTQPSGPYRFFSQTGFHPPSRIHILPPGGYPQSAERPSLWNHRNHA